jgi:iron complex transport system substrate-binding protein
MRRLASLIAVFALTACGTAPAAAPAAPAETTTAASAATPVTIDNCGRQVTFERPPSRVVSTGQEGTEILLALGLADRIVGISRTFNDPPEEFRTAYAALPRLAEEKVAPKEATLAARPDLVVAVWADYDLDPAEGLAGREELAAAGAKVLSLSANCATDPSTVTIEDTYRDILDLGRVFGVSDRAEKVVGEMKAKITEVQERIAGEARPKVLLYANGEGPIGVSGAGLASDLVRLAGGDNVFADIKEGFGRVAIEAAAARKPEVFVTNYYEPGPTPQEKAAFLRKALPHSPAAKQERVVAVPDASLNAGIRNADAVVALAEGFFPDSFR